MAVEFYFWYGKLCPYKIIQMVVVGKWSNSVASLLRLIVLKRFFSEKIYVMFISDFERTKHFHCLYVSFKKDQKRTKVAKFSK